MWSEQNQGIERRFQFASFLEAMTFMHRAVPLIEEMNHHPEWSNVYARVDVRLTTHDAGGVTDLDWALAQRLDALYAELTAS